VAKPQGVRIVREDGTVLPVELVHLEPENGLDMWGIANAEFRINHDRVEMDGLPPRTGLRFIGLLPEELR